MKTILRILLVVAGAIATSSPLGAQERQWRDDFFTVRGVVRDASTGRSVAGVSVMVPDTRVGTVTNADGSFSLKINHASGARLVEFSHLGYTTRTVPVSGVDISDLTINLSPGAIEMERVTVVHGEARHIVEEAIRRIEVNYSDRPMTLTGFYRETVRKRSTYIDIAEAVTEIFRTPYDGRGANPRVRLVKGRRLVSPRPGDTLAVKLQGGPNIYLMGDVISNRDMIFDEAGLDNYDFALETPVMIDGNTHFTVVFSPRMIYADFALFTGRIYIDMTSYTVTRAEYSLDMSDRDKVTRMILRRKPASLRFTPQEVSYVLSYRRREGRSYLHYSRADIRFRCDWRRRLFATGYTVSSETVITDGRAEGATTIPLRESFRSDQILSDRVEAFSGPGFWEAYNIIEPTESLENAVSRLMRQKK
jgi:hypothetical protein